MLADEIDKAQRKVRTDAYQMSIGEVVGMYDTGEIVIDPEFQRLFRWTISQKSKLIESLLLGIPLPPIFVFERNDGKWELVDGLQRLSTILEFMGKLHDGTGRKQSPSILESTKYLPSLHNSVWEKSNFVSDVPLEQQIEIESSNQLTIKRARLSVEILKRPSDENTKYDLFQRLNSGGTLANAQELRNCIMLMVNKEYFREIKAMAETQSFLQVVSISDEQREKQRHMEMAVRFLVHTVIPYDGKLDIEEYIDEGILTLSQTGKGHAEAALIANTFDLLNNVAGSDVLRRYENGKHSGKIGLVGLEVIAVGVAKNLPAILALPNAVEFVREKIQLFWSEPDAVGFTAAGQRGTTRIQKTVPFGENWFRP